jgi:hypothetical protein
MLILKILSIKNKKDYSVKIKIQDIIQINGN